MRVLRPRLNARAISVFAWLHLQTERMYAYLTSMSPAALMPRHGSSHKMGEFCASPFLLEGLSRVVEVSWRFSSRGSGFARNYSVEDPHNSKNRSRKLARYSVLVRRVTFSVSCLFSIFPFSSRKKSGKSSKGLKQLHNQYAF